MSETRSVPTAYDARYAEQAVVAGPCRVPRRRQRDARRRRARCANCSTGSARRWPSCGAASTGSGRTSRSRPATAGSIPYLADLLATNLVPSMDARGQRLDVANTIYYRRRKGTVALLEQLAHDVTGYETRVIEFFRRLGRNRHDLDPAIGCPAEQPDPAAALHPAARGAAHRAAHRHPGRRLGRPAQSARRQPHRHRLRRVPPPGRRAARPRRPRLVRHPEDRLLPVADGRAARRPGDAGAGRPAAPGHYAFDPTGRQIAAVPAAAARGANDYGESWLPVAVWQLPMPLTTPLWEAITAEHARPRTRGLPRPGRASLWPARRLSVSATGSGDPLARRQVRVWPEVGRFRRCAGAPGRGRGRLPLRAVLAASAPGPYDRRQTRRARPSIDPQPRGAHRRRLGDLPAQRGRRPRRHRHGRGHRRADPDRRRPGRLRRRRRSTCHDPRPNDQERAVIRVAPGDGPWIVHRRQPARCPAAAGGAAAQRRRHRAARPLRRGRALLLHARPRHQRRAAHARRRSGTSASTAATSRPVTVWVEGEVRTLTVDRCITGPIRTRTAG